MIPQRRRPFVMVIVAFFGSAALFNFINSPGFETTRAVDVVRLIGVGMCFGVVIVLLVMAQRGKNGHLKDD